MLIAHKRENETQALFTHLENTANLAKKNAEKFGAEEWAYLIGLLHDVGKYSLAFQQRILNNGPLVDHATAGAQLVWEKYGPGFCLLPAFCIAGHHGGLPNGGTEADHQEIPTLRGRLQKEIPDYQTYQNELVLPPVPAFPRLYRPISPWFSLYILTKMLYSSLVDADYTDTYEFMQDNQYTNHTTSLAELYHMLEDYFVVFDQQVKETPLNLKRHNIRECCLSQARGKQGFYTLTVPTGGGKTLSGMAFALKHGAQHHLDRVIYTIPYTSIIEQNAGKYKEVFGDENVLEQHGEIDFRDIENSNLRLAAEKWDVPIVVTTNVQFFESFFANKPGRSRKLHNIAKSVIVLDEAQMLPLDLLLPCLALLIELVQNYYCTVVFCTATQPVLEYLLPQITEKSIETTEICPQVFDNYWAFKRNEIEHIGTICKADLCQALLEQSSSLTIVNTRKLAFALFHQIENEHKYYLTTLLCPVHRKIKLDEIRTRLANGLPCTVIATSLIEAGVDIDLPVVYRQMAGLDSIVQAAGRCNREGKKQQAKVKVFELVDAKGKLPESMVRNIEISKMIFRQYQDVLAPAAMNDYFTQLYQFSSVQGLDSFQILSTIDDCQMDFPFVDIAKRFQLISTPTKPVIIPYDDVAKELIQQLRWTEQPGRLLRKLQCYTVNIYDKEWQNLLGNGKLELISGEIAILTDIDAYDKQCGLNIELETGIGIFFT